MQTHPVLRYTIGDSSLGLLLVAVGERGICAILIDDEREALVADLQRRFRRAELRECPAAENPCFEQVRRCVDDPSQTLAAPLELHGTPFQRKVWDALLAIPKGTTTNYAEIARRIGAPTSSRAVGAAIAANPLAVVVPCHRVLRSDGALSGYRWGVSRKRALLEREARAAAGGDCSADRAERGISRISLAGAADQE